MAVLPDNAAELAIMAGEIGAGILEGRLSGPSAAGGWRLGGLDLEAYLARLRDQHLVLIIAPIAGAEPVTFPCDVCGQAMTHLSPCPRCARRAAEAAQAGERLDILDQVEDLLDDDAGGEG